MSSLEGSMPAMAPTPRETGRRWRGIDVFGMSLISLGLFFGLVVLLVVGLMFGSGVTTEPDQVTQLVSSVPFVIGATLASFVALSVAVLAGRMWRRLSWDVLGFQPITLKQGLLMAGVAVGLRLLAVPLAYVLLWLGFPMDNPQLQMLAPADLGLWSGIAIAVGIGMLIPFAEELFFRGVLYTWLRERWGVGVGVVVSSLVFGLVHGHPTLAVITFTLGVACAVAYERTGSLWSSVVIHAVFNLLGVVLVYALLASGVSLPGM